MSSQSNNKTGKFADVPIRVRSWLYIIAVFAMAISNTWLMSVFVAWITFQSLREFKSMFGLNTQFLVLSILLSVLQLVLPIWVSNYCSYIVYALLIAFLAEILIFFTQKKSIIQHPEISLSIPISFLCFGHLWFISNMTGYNTDDIFFGTKLLVFLVVVTELNDVFQYLSGKFFGKRKIFPNVSPNKTLEGCIGGVLMTLVLSNVLGYFLLPYTQIVISAIGVTLGIAGIFGDVLMSYIKRKAGVKDTGNLIPGHGGLLDRMDSLIFNAPIFYGIIYFLSR